MKKSTGAILIIIIILLLGAIGVLGYFFIKGNSDFTKQIGELKNEVANIGNNSGTKENNIATNVTPTENKTASVKTNKDVAGNYKYEIKDDNGYVFGANLFLAEDGTFGCFYDVGGQTGSYEIDKDTIVLNVIFTHGGGIGLDIDKQNKTLIIKEDGSLETKDIKVSSDNSESIILTKISNDTSGFNIRDNIKSSIGSGPEYQFNYNY